MRKIETAVILAGGAGTRMNPYTGEFIEPDRPKPMIDINGKPLLHWVIEKWLSKYSIKHIVFGVAYKKEFLIDYFTKNSLGMKINFSEHTVEGGTGEGFRKAISRFVEDDTFLAFNGDELTNLNINDLAVFHLKYDAVATICTAPCPIPYGIINIDENGTICGFDEKPVLHDKFISVGIYMLNHDIINYLPQTGSIERDTFRNLAEKGRLKAYKVPKGTTWATVNDIKQLEKASQQINTIWE